MLGGTLKISPNIITISTSKYTHKMILRKRPHLKKERLFFLLPYFLFLLLVTPTSKVDKPLKTSNLLPCYTSCPDQYGSTAFYDFKLQECWSCPKRYTPTLEGVYSRRASKQYKYGLYADAKRLGKLTCRESLIAKE